MSLVTGAKNRLHAYRNPVYLLYAIFGASLFTFCAFIASSGISSVELALFDVFNNMSDSFYAPMVLITFFGSIGAIPLVVLIALFRKHYANALKVFLGGGFVVLFSRHIVDLGIRSVSPEILSSIDTRQFTDVAHQYPSVVMAVVAVLALTSYIYLPKRLHKFITAVVILVGISQMYLGLAFPIDLLGGYGLGLFVSGMLNFSFGSRRYDPVPPEKVGAAFAKYGYKVKDINIAAVDARGSVPYILRTNETGYFVKVVGFENNVADWLFKLSRQIIYKRLEDEQPYMSPKRQLEHEAYVAMLAMQAGARTPKIVSIFEADAGRWAMAQEMIDGKSLDRVSKERITSQVLDDIWGQVKILHDHKIVHRDLRAANIFLDANSDPWLIDFGFSEGSTSEDKFHRDTVELVASLSLLTKPEYVVKSALKIIGKDELIRCMPYLEYSSLSGATTTGLKKDKQLLKDIRKELGKATGNKKVKMVKLKRFDLKFLLILISLGIAINVLAPQFGSFNDSLDAAQQANLMYIMIGLILSSLTYFLAGLAYKFAAIYPLKLWPTVLIQVASSFASKLAPAGTGSIAINGRYLYKNNHDSVEAGAVAGINTIVGFVAHLSVVVMVSLFTKGSILDLIPEIRVPLFVVILAIFALITALISIKIFPTFNKIFVNSRDKVFEQFKHYRENYLKLILCFSVSVVITLAYSVILFVCALAMNVHLSMLDVVYVFTIGSIVASVTPTPGGLGGTEAAYVASLTSIGVDSSVALAITLLYRLMTFWLPIIPGFAAFKYATSKDYI